MRVANSIAILITTAFTLGGETPRLKPGAYVEILIGTTWKACTVAGEYRQRQDDYPVTCGPQDLFAQADDAHMRPRKVSAEERKIEIETSAALARLPRAGTGIGARYGTRDPKVCRSRRNPVSGAMNAAMAREYVICDLEVEHVTSLVLVTNVRVEVAAGRGFNAPTDSWHTGIDPKQAVYDIRGSFTHYECRQALPTENAFARTHTCSAFEESNAQGMCWVNTFGDWHCVMHDLHAEILHPREYLLPPETN